MALYIVELEAKLGYTLENGTNTVIVSAEDTDSAKEIAAAATGGASNAAWEEATVTALAEPSSLEGFRLEVQVTNPTTGNVAAYAEVEGGAAATLDDLGTAAAVALNESAVIAGAAYVGATNTLTVAASTDNLGDHKLSVKLLPPTTWSDPTIPMTAFIGAITDEGVAAADLIVLLVDAALPGILGECHKKF